jgi:phosphatidylglycerophosphate synthase
MGDKLFAVILALMVWNRGYVAGWLLLCLLLCEIHAILVPLVVFIRRIKAGVPLLPVPKLKVNRWGKVKTAWLASAMGLVLIFHFLGFTAGIKFALF